MQVQENKTEETNNPVSSEPKSLEQQMQELDKISKMRHKMLSGLVRAHVADYLQTLAFQPGISGNQKADMIVKLLDGLEGVLDFGLDVTGAQIPEKGVYGKKVANIAGILAQALDNRMLLVAQNMQKEENETKTEEVTETQETV